MMNKHLNIIVVAILVAISILVASFFTLSSYNGAEAAGADDFVTTWKTDNAGTSADNQITIPTTGGGYDYSVDWGDGSSDTNVTGNITHTYDAAGTYTIRISGDFPRIFINNGGDQSKLLSVDQWGTIEWTSMERAFDGAINMNVLASDAPDLSNVTSMSEMFEAALSLTADLDNWDVSNVTDMSNMFFNAQSFNGDISTWNVSNVTNMDFMFYKAFLFDSDISGWNTSSLVTMNRAFFSASSFNQDLTGWDVSRVTNMDQLFDSAFAFNGDISGWTVSNVTSMNRMFNKAIKFNGDISSWDVSNVEDMAFMFYKAEEFNSDISGWNTTSLDNLNSTFWEAGSFNQDLTGWDVSGVTDMARLFHSAFAFNGDVSTWNVSNVNTMDSMFYKANVFSGDISEWNVSNVTTMDGMFYKAEEFNSDISEWTTSSLESLNGTFWEATSFNQDISGWDVSGVTNMNQLFDDAYVFNADISSWDVSNVTNFTNFLDNTSFSTKNYDVLLIAWSELDLEDELTFGAEGLSYCHGAEERQDIIDTYSWTFIGDTLDCTNANKFATGVLVDAEEIGEVLENQETGTSVGVLTAVDPDEEDSHNFEKSCTTSGADDDLFNLDGENTLWTAASFNFEDPNDADGDNIYEVCVSATDDGKPNLTAEVTLYVTVTNVNEAPIDLMIDGAYQTNFNERRKVGTGVGRLTTDDNGEENPDGFVYAVACSSNGDDDDFFKTDGDNLVSDFQFFASTPRDANKDNIYEVCVKTIDDGGLSYDKVLRVSIQSIGTQSGSSNAGENSPTPTPTNDNSQDKIDSSSDRTDDTNEQENIDTEISTDEETKSESEQNDFYSNISEDENSLENTEKEPVVETNEVDNSSSSGGGGSNADSYSGIDFDLDNLNVTRGEFLKLIMDVYNKQNGLELTKFGTEPFPDVDPSYKNYWYVVEGYQRGIILGDEGYAYVNRELNRVEALAMVLRLLDIDYESYEYNQTYNDVNPNKWYAPVIEAAMEIGLEMWGGSENFRPGMSLLDTEVGQLLEETMERL